MKEIQILFKTLMVQRILDDMKTLTRRMSGLGLINEWPGNWSFVGEIHPSYKQKQQPVFRFENKECKTSLIDIQCPYGQRGDLLWVRETWRGIKQDVGPERYEYRASEKINTAGKWKPSIYMPKDAARLWLRVSSIKVERLQDISEEDAKQEGVEPLLCQELNRDGSLSDKHYSSYVEGFKALWIKINGRESWDANPWVWVVKFEVLSKNGRPAIVENSGKDFESNFSDAGITTATDQAQKW